MIYQLELSELTFPGSFMAAGTVEIIIERALSLSLSLSKKPSLN